MKFRTTKDYWLFVFVSGSIWFTGIGVTALDALSRNRQRRFQFGPLNAARLFVFTAGIALRPLAKKTLGRDYAYGLRVPPSGKISRQGIYGYIRNPCYLAGILYSLGIPLIFSSRRGLVIMLLIIPAFLYRIRIEEKMMLEEFGKEYRDYMESTKRLIPGVF